MNDSISQVPNEGLAPRPTGPLSCTKPLFSVGSLERAFLNQFPAADAEDWDLTGLSVGDRTASIKKVAFTLDPTVEAIELAAEQGANALITHHPPYIDPPCRFEPKAHTNLSSGGVVWASIKNDIALLSFHTALDVSHKASQVLPRLLSLEFCDIVQKLSENELKGYGQLCQVKNEDAPLTLGQLAARCVAVFGRQPRVYGDFSQKLERIVTCTGSVGGVLNAALSRDVDCVVCGEVKYHDALSASQAGIAVIDIGHDVSEWPLVAVLVATAREIGIEESAIVVIDQQNNWTTPETTRM